MFLIFDTETTGLFQKPDDEILNLEDYPRAVQIAWQLHDSAGHLIEAQNLIIYPESFDIPFNAAKVHGITTAIAKEKGLPVKQVLESFTKNLSQVKYLVGHNINYDIRILKGEFLHLGIESPLSNKEIIDTSHETTEFCALPGGKGGKFKYPKLEELHDKLFGYKFDEAHNAAADVEATARIFFKTLEQKIITRPDISIDPQIMNYLEKIKSDILKTVDTRKVINTDEAQDLNLKNENLNRLRDLDFSHLQIHSQFSVLQSTVAIKALIKKAAEQKNNAVSITDLGNMFGAFHFVKEVFAHNKEVDSFNAKIEAGEISEPPKSKLKGIVGCEFFVCKDHKNKDYKDNGYQVVFLAKNKTGYHNLAKLCSIAHTEGSYYVPRIDKTLVEKYKNDLIVLTGSLQGEIPYLILNVGEKQAEEAFQWWHNLFGDDFYVSLQRHGLEEEDVVNKTLIQFAKKYGVKCVAANNVFYLNKSDAQAHDILLCVKEGELVSTPIGRGRGYRYGFPNNEFYYKSQDEMKALFADIPEAIENISLVLDKIENYKLERDVLLPAFDIPQGFIDQDDYLKYLTFEGAKKRYNEITPEIEERLNFELATIKNTGYPGYFLIVQDFTNKAREMGVAVGPGRGSAAGSAVAYCIGITNVDPIKYNLLFERFLNPDRVSLPDIDIDFDDVGRQKVIDYVINKYGRTQVAQIITYGMMKAKSALRDTARVLNLPLPEADRLSKTFPESPDSTLRKILKDEGIDPGLKEKLGADQIALADEFRKMAKQNDLVGQTIQQAHVLEGSLRNTGIHACGVIITPEDITNLIPVSLAKDSDLFVTQFDNSVVESAGLLKMDFLGLKTLTIINNAIEIIKNRHQIKIDPDAIPLTDEKTFELFQRGDTVGTFQFESAGMQKYLRELKPDRFEDLIAMNALYRPGPLEYIPKFIARKNGLEEVVYDLPGMEEYLEETYGITVYQEQVMLLSQKLANFTKGDADVLRKAMGKKQKDTLDKMKTKFMAGCESNSYDLEKCEKIWTDWEAFASYAFNKSHSTCYAYIAFQTAYLKANYPQEYMAAVLNAQGDISDITGMMEECKRMKIPVLGPDINESDLGFSVNAKGEIRFGLAAIKGVGEMAAKEIIDERNKSGAFASIFDFTKRVNLKSVNKRVMEALAKAGGFDGFETTHRAQYFHTLPGEDLNTLEKALRFGNAFQAAQGAAQASLFGGTSDVEIPEPSIPQCEPFSLIEQLNKEKEVVGMYLTGHPLDEYKFELEVLCRGKLEDLKNLDSIKGKELRLGGIVTAKQDRISKTGKPFGAITLEDYSGSHEFMLFGKDYIEFKNYMEIGYFLAIRGRVQNREWPKDSPEIEFKIQAIELLSELKNKLVESFQITLDIKDLSQEFINGLHEQIADKSGSARLKINIVDSQKNISLNFMAQQTRINPDYELLKYLKTFNARFELNN